MTESTAVAVQGAPPAAPAKVPSETLKARFVEAFASGRLDKWEPEKQQKFLIALGDMVGLRAELGELMIYQGKPYVTIDGRIRLAHRSGMLVGLEVRPASQLERKNFHAEVDEELWICDVYRRGAHRKFTGWGVAGGVRDRNQQVGKSHPRELARKRARYDALRIAFPVLEEFTELHTSFIEAAEQEMAQHRERFHPVLTAGYDNGGPDGARIEETAETPPAIEEIVADATVEAQHPTHRTVEGGPTEAQIDRWMTLVEAPHVTDLARERMVGKLKDKKVSQQEMAGWITALELGLPTEAAAT